MDFARAATVGLREKAIGLVNAARSEGIEIDLVAINDSKLLFWRSDEPEPAWPDFDTLGSIKSKIFTYQTFWRKLILSVNFDEYGYLWWRSLPPSPAQVTFLKKAKKSKVILICDLPTYPVVNEAKGLKSWFNWFHERRELVIMSLADHILTSSPHTEIEGTPTIYVSNGFDPQFVRSVSSRASGKIRLVGIGQWAYWHGIDRLFLGIANAGLQREFELDLAGEGPGKGELQLLGQRLGLTINWRNAIWGKERKQFLEDADAAIGSLGVHRKNVMRDRSLKHRMYGASGLPMLLTPADDEMSGAPLVIQVPVGDENVNAINLKNSILSFRKKSKLLRSQQREFTNGLTWSSTYGSLWDLLT